MTNAKCAICDKDYYVCMSCKNRIRLKPWTVYTDTPECYKIFQIIHGYSTGVYTKEETKEKLQNIETINFDNLKENIRKIIEDILFEETEKTPNNQDNQIDDKQDDMQELVKARKTCKKKKKK